MELITLDPRVRELADETAPLTKLASGFTFTEGPVFARGVRYFTDFPVNKIYAYQNGEVSVVNDHAPRVIGMFYDRRKDRVLCCAGDVHAITDLSGNVIIDNYNGTRLNGTNDCIVDSRGRIFFTDPLTRKIEGPQIGRSGVYMYDESTKAMTLLDDTLSFPNGLALSPDEQTLYIADTNQNALFALSLSGGGLTAFARFDSAYGDGKPDGLRLDADGNVYATGPGGVWLVSPKGEPLGLIKIPGVAANLCFDDTGLFITAGASVYHVDVKGAGLC